MVIAIDQRVVAAFLWSVTLLTSGCQMRTAQPDGPNIAAPPEAQSLQDVAVVAWHEVSPLEQPLAQLSTVFWEPDDTTTLRQWIVESGQMRGRQVLEIGPGTGLLSLLCAQAGAESVTAIDINPYAVINTSYNAQRLGYGEQIDVRQLPNIHKSPFTQLRSGEQFDLIISNPPWEDQDVQTLDQYALYDPGMQLCEFLLRESHQYLRPHGQLILVYGARSALQFIQARAPEQGWDLEWRDARAWDSLPEVFVPGVTLVLTRRAAD